MRVLADGCLAGRRALVTGAGSGIGRAISLRLTELGMTVVGAGRRGEALDATAALCPSGRFTARPCNLRDPAALEALVAGLPEDGLDLLVNNAGGQFYAAAEAISRRGWDAVVDLNLTAVFALTQACRSRLARRRGAVASISLSGVERGSKGLAHSVAARAGVLGLTRTLALEWAAEGIRLNCLAPGTVATEAFAAAAGEAEVARLVAATPLGRTTAPEEVAELVAFLASPAATMITGQLLHLDGGAGLGPGLHMAD